MSIVLVNSAHASPGASGGSTSAIDTTGATLIVVAVSDLSGLGMFSDSAGNHWTANTPKSVSSSHCRLFHCVLPITSATHTFTYSGSSVFPTIEVAAFSGAGGFIVESGAAANGTSEASGSMTPTVNGSLIVSAECTDASNAGETIISGGLNVINFTNYVSSVNMGGGIAYLVQGTAGAVNPTWGTSAAALDRAVVSAVFGLLPAAAPSGSTPIFASGIIQGLGAI